MRVAFFGLDHHARTGSNRFLLDLLERHATVEAFFAAPDGAAVRRAAPGFDEARYDAVVVWQLHEAFALLSGRHPNVTFAPMLDAMWRGGAFTWRPSFNAAKILCFSWALREQVMRRAPVHALAQYFPDPAAHPAVTDFDTLRGVLWYRRRDIPPAAAFALTAGTRFDSLAIHDAPDPGHEAAFPDAAPAHVGRLVRTEWSPDGRAFADALSAANVFFAPRPMEGIGMAFLEAMAAGLCVVAPDAPTMNEYISHGTNGLLYAPGSRAPLDFTRAREIGARAREGIARGRARWEASVPALIDFLTTPTAVLAQRWGSRGVVLRATAPPATPAELAVVAPGATPPAQGWLLAQPAGAPLQGYALAHAVAEAPPEAAIIRGHHLLRTPDGAEALHRTADLAAGWARLLAEGPGAAPGLGVPEAALIRAGLPERLGMALPRDPAALAALLLRARDAGETIHDADAILSLRVARDDPAVERAAWRALVRERQGEDAASHLDAAWNAAIAAAAARDAAAAPARRALALIAALDRLSPALGRAAERLLLGGALRRLRTMLRR